MVTRPDGTTVDLAYDTAGRLSTITIPRGTTTYNYNITTGNLDSISAPGSEGISYDYDGSLLTDITWSGTISGFIEIDYDDNFWMDTQTVNGSDVVSFDYDDDGLLTVAGDLTLTRDPDHGLITDTTLSNITSSVTYNDIGEIETETFSYSGSPIYSMAITDRDDLGRIKDREITVSGITDTYAYTYDTAGRLWTASINAATNTYLYDDNGNRDGGTYDAQDRLTSYGSNTYTYDNNGDLETKTNTDGTTNYTYDELGNLISVSLYDGTSIEYVIDAQNRRIGKKVNGSLTQGFLYKDQLNPITELDGAGSVISRFIYAEKSNVPDYMVKSGTTYKIISDHLGSPRLVVDVDTGTIAQQIEYDEFGNILSDSSPGFQPFGFAGGLYDSDTGLVRFGARDYDPEVGRWTAKDPILFNGGDTNLYGYVLNDPVNFIDPLGLIDIIVGVEGEVAVGIIGYDVSGGIVIDTSNIQQSGLYISYGPANGVTAGVGFIVGSCKEVGDNYANFDVNIEGVSATANWGEETINGISIGVGPGLGASGSWTNTATFTYEDWLNWIK